MAGRQRWLGFGLMVGSRLGTPGWQEDSDAAWVLWDLWFDTASRRRLPGSPRTIGLFRLGNYFEAKDRGLVEVEAEDEGAIGGQVVRLGPPGTAVRPTR